jgi:hypothetical protein
MVGIAALTSSFVETSVALCGVGDHRYVLVWGLSVSILRLERNHYWC